jgi:hypothetical protein
MTSFTLGLALDDSFVLKKSKYVNSFDPQGKGSYYQVRGPEKVNPSPKVTQLADI